MKTCSSKGVDAFILLPVGALVLGQPSQRPMEEDGSMMAVEG
jgi:hypothetical protein